MKIKISKDIILEGLQKIQSVVSSRTTLPILQNILVKTEKDKIVLGATDLDVSVRTSVAAEISKAGATTLPARRIFSIFKELPAGEIEIDADDRNVATIKSGASVFKIIGISEEDFPALPKFEGGKVYTVDQAVFRDMLRNTSYAASRDESRYILNGVLLSFRGDKLTVVATDGRRMALYEQEVEFPKEAEADLVLPFKAVDELVKTLADEGSLKIHAVENQVCFEFNDMLIISKLIEGTYPNFRQVIPAHSEERIKLEREALLAALRRVSLISSEKSTAVKMAFSKNRLEINASTAEIGEARETIAIAYTGKALSVSFNPEFLMDPLRSLVKDEVYLELTDDLSPGVLKADVPFLYVLMPMRTT
jgi:DNA polymerase-3 subunit beta